MRILLIHLFLWQAENFLDMELSWCVALSVLLIGLSTCIAEPKLEDVMARLESLELWKENAQKEITELKQKQTSNLTFKL